MLSLQQPQQGTFTVPIEAKARDWNDDKASDQMAESKVDGVFPADGASPDGEDVPKGVKITIDTETDYEGFGRK